MSSKFSNKYRCKMQNLWTLRLTDEKSGGRNCHDSVAVYEYCGAKICSPPTFQWRRNVNILLFIKYFIFILFLNKRSDLRFKRKFFPTLLLLYLASLFIEKHIIVPLRSTFVLEKIRRNHPNEWKNLYKTFFFHDPITILSE